MMDLQKEREAFEAWFSQEFRCDEWEYNPFSRMEFNGIDAYSCSTVNTTWSAWQAAKAQAVQEWISVDDRLPNRQVNVLVASKHDFVCIASLTNNHKNNKFYDGDGLAINSITHWMPLPDAPLEQTNDK